MDRSRDRSQCNSSDRRSTPRMANIYRSVNRSCKSLDFEYLERKTSILKFSVG